MAKSLFRDSAVERLSSPERLDTLMTVTSPGAWLALVAMGAVIAGALVWGFTGRTQDTIPGAGILLHRGGLFEVGATSTGTLTSMSVAVGDQVEQGMIVAQLAQPDLQHTIEQIQARLDNLRKQGSQSGALIRGGQQAQIAAAAEELRQLDLARTHATTQLAYLQERVKAQDEAVRRGLINRDVSQATNQEIARVRESMGGLDTQRKQLDARLAGLRSQTEQSLLTIEQQARTEQDQLDRLRAQYERDSVVRSPYRGRVVAVLADRGELIQTGQPLFELELPDEQLQAYVFVGLAAKQIQPGMLALVSPAGLSWEEYGYVVAKVRSISGDPVSPAAMNVYLRNSTLVQEFGGQAVYLVELDLEEAKTPSGFRWTTRTGPALTFGSGTMVSAQITIREQAPITLVIPALRRWLGA